MTFGDLQTITLDWLDDANAGYFTLPVLKMRLNLALKELQKRLISANEEYYTACATTNLVVTQSTYALPSDFLQIIRLEYVNSTSARNPKIMYITPNQRDLIVDINGDPGWYYFQKNTLVLLPTPNVARVMHLEYSYIVVDMVLDSDIPDAPLEFHEYIAVLATRDCFLKDGRPLEPINDKLAKYELLLKQIADQRRADGPRMIVQTDALEWA